MEKIRLDFEQLEVETFEVVSLPRTRRGTVHAGEMSCICGTSKIGGCWCTESCEAHGGAGDA